MADAHDLMRKLNHDDVVTVATVQAGQSLLHRQAELIDGMVHEGFLDNKSALSFFNIIDHDTERLCFLQQKRETIKLKRRRSSETLFKLSKL